MATRSLEEQLSLRPPTDRNRPLRIGITGGMGCGKTTVVRAMNKLFNIPCYDCDSRAKWLMEHDKALKAAIRARFTEQAYITDLTNGTERLDRAFLASQIFGNDEARHALEHLVHPAVEQDFMLWVAAFDHPAYPAATCPRPPFILKESAILFESGAHRGLDAVVVVESPLELRIERIAKRDTMPRSQIEARIAAQSSPETLARQADFLLHNNEQESLLEQIVALYEKITNFADL